MHFTSSQRPGYGLKTASRCPCFSTFVRPDVRLCKEIQLSSTTDTENKTNNQNITIKGYSLVIKVAYSSGCDHFLFYFFADTRRADRQMQSSEHQAGEDRLPAFSDKRRSPSNQVCLCVWVWALLLLFYFDVTDLLPQNHRFRAKRGSWEIFCRRLWTGIK